MHLSLQHGDNLILKRMKRRHAREDAIALVERLRTVRPDMAFGADLIAGFPTETETQFENSAKLIEECGLAFVHVFPYSPRPGTPAARMPQLQKSVIKARAAQLREVASKALSRHLDQHVGAKYDALVERGTLARLADFTPVRVEGNQGEAGRVSRVHITRHDNETLFGTCIE